MHRRPRSAGLLLATADAAALIALRPRFGRLAAHLAAPHAWVGGVGTDRALAELCGAAGWLVGLWLALGLLAGLAARLPGAAGSAATRAARALLPRVLQRLLIGSAGLGVLLAPVAAAATTPAPPAAHSALFSSLPAPGWPVDPARPAGADPPRPAQSDAVTVRAGDSLWLIAQRRLGPGATPARVAAAWPYWYAANRATIGADPDLIRPGTELRAPVIRP